MKFRYRHLISAGIAVTLIGAQALSVGADTADDIAYLQNQQAAAEASLSELQTSIGDLEDQKTAITGKIDSYQAQLVTTIASIQMLDEQIEAKEEQLAQTAKDLEAAKADEKEQYEAMKKRIQYLYEEGGNEGWSTILLDSASLSSVVDKADNTQALYDYDRNELENYSEAIEEVTRLETEQVNQKSELQTMKKEQEAEQDQLEDMLADAKEKSDDFDAKIEEAYALANDYQALIAEQNEQIAALEQKLREEEEAARKAEEERRAAEEAARLAAEEAAQQEAAEQEASEREPDPTQEPEQEAPEEPDVPVSGNGSAVVNYAMQFLGGPYVWGGTSLTNGCDCSGFTMGVFAHFGVSLPHFSDAQAGCGTGVSYASAQPGDIIIYSGHVAIYIGNGQIIHAANEAQGICIGSATYAPMLAVPQARVSNGKKID